MKKEETLQLQNELVEIKAQMKELLVKLEKSEERSKKLALRIFIPMMFTLITSVGVMCLSTFDNVFGTDMANSEVITHIKGSDPQEMDDMNQIAAIAEENDFGETVQVNQKDLEKAGQNSSTNIQNIIVNNKNEESNYSISKWAIAGGTFNTLRYAKIEQKRLAKYYKEKLLIIKKKNKFQIIIIGYSNEEIAQEDLFDLNDLGAVNGPYLINTKNWCNIENNKEGYIDCV